MDIFYFIFPTFKILDLLIFLVDSPSLDSKGDTENGENPCVDYLLQGNIVHLNLIITNTFISILFAYFYTNNFYPYIQPTPTFFSPAYFDFTN